MSAIEVARTVVQQRTVRLEWIEYLPLSLRRWARVHETIGRRTETFWIEQSWDGALKCSCPAFRRDGCCGHVTAHQHLFDSLPASQIENR